MHDNHSCTQRVLKASLEKVRLFSGCLVTCVTRKKCGWRKQKKRLFFNGHGDGVASQLKRPDVRVRKKGEQSRGEAKVSTGFAMKGRIY